MIGVRQPDAAAIGEFEIARGGLFFELQQRVGLLEAEALRVGPRAALAVALALGVPLLLSLVEGHAWGPSASRPFLLDLGVWARFGLGMAIFVLMERMTEERLRLLQRRFTDAPLLAPASWAAAQLAVIRALRLRDSRAAELVALVLAFALALFAALAVDRRDVSWLARTTEVGSSLTLAGWWCALVSAPLYWFLVLRWLWRHVVWGLLLRDIARLELRLVVTHPDGAGGLAFIGASPNAFAAFVLALSCAMAASAIQEILHGRIDLKLYGMVMGIWLVIVLALFATPLLAFARPLARLKAATLAAAGAVATRHQRAVERQLLGRNVLASADADDATTADIPDPAKLYAAAGKLPLLPVARTALLPIGAAALLPMVVVGAGQLPFKELLKVAKGLLL